MIRKDTLEVRTVHEKCEHYHDETGKVIRSEGMVHDITERKQVEQALLTYTEQLRNSNETLEDFAFIASHDLQEPLRKIHGFGRILKTDHAQALGEQGQDYIDRMQQSAGRMQAMLDGLLAYARIISQGKPFMPIDLGQILSEVVSDLDTRLMQTDGQVEVGSLPVIKADPTQIRQLIQNLLVNALKFHRPGVPPRVKVTWNPTSNGQIVLSVADNGIGFEPQQAAGLFKPFHRLHGRSEYEGSGMGLAICKKIVERHAGEIEVESQPGLGTTFRVTLPQGL